MRNGKAPDGPAGAASRRQPTHVERQRILVAFGARAMAAADAGALLDRAAAAAAEGLGVGRAKVLRHRADRGDLLVVAGVGWNPGVVGTATVPDGMTSPAGRALRTGQPVSIADLAAEPGLETPPLLVEHGIVSLLNVPIRADGDSLGDSMGGDDGGQGTPAGGGPAAVWGVLEADGAEPRAFDEEATLFLLGLANLLGTAIARLDTEAHLRAVADLVPDLLWRNDLSGNSSWYNRRWLDYTGQTMDEAAGDGWMEVVHPDDRRRAIDNYRRAIAGNRPLEHEVRLRGTDGLHRWFLVRAEPVRDATGHIVQYFGSVTDIHARRAAEEALREARDGAERARAAAERADREKSRFLATVSHDLRQPVMAALLFAETLSRQPLRPAERELMEPLLDSLSNLSGMLSGLLESARLDSGIVQAKIRDFDLDELLRRLHREFQGLAREAGLRLDMPPARHIVRSDPLLVELVLRNLISNALKYTEDGGVTVEARPGAAADTLTVEVSDTGRGIPPDEIDRIFEDYFQTGSTARDHPRGFGIGLATARRTAGLLGTTVAVRSQPGRGSTFALPLPLVRPVRGRKPRTPPAGRSAGRSGARTKGADTARAGARAGAMAIAEAAEAREAEESLAGRVALVVDDEPLVLKALEVLLRSWGVRVHAARTLAQAGAVLEDLPEPPDFVIADHSLARGERGTEAIAAARGRGTPVAVLVTGDTAVERLAEARASGASLLHKPVDPERLKALLRDAVTA